LLAFRDRSSLTQRLQIHFDGLSPLLISARYPVAASQKAAMRAFFGATVRYANAAGVERVVSIVGMDEVDLNRNQISWVSPLGRALMKSAPGDRVALQAPGGTAYLSVLEVYYQRISVERSVNHLEPRLRQRYSRTHAGRTDERLAKRRQGHARVTTQRSLASEQVVGVPSKGRHRGSILRVARRSPRTKPRFSPTFPKRRFPSAIHALSDQGHREGGKRMAIDGYARK
jgi:hypothetical protein